ncbi:MAG: (2Fe-2S) ferredoxin domain-containing protein [bacterium]|jgi:NADP-reducing hydrogenase subunit HndB
MTALKNLDDLRKLRERVKEDLNERFGGEIKIIVGMGTCGIAAGAREVMAAILNELRLRNINATVTQTGCIGMCEREPLVDIVRPGEKRITYGRVTPRDAKRLVAEHVLHGRVVEDLVVARFEE